MKRGTLFAACLCVLTMTYLAQARASRGWVGATYVPLDRLIPNMETFIKDYPNDPQGYYLLARMHYFVFVDQSALVPITPIIFSLQEHASVLDLLDPNSHVTFDLDGTGRSAQWPWIKPSTGLLVWDSLNKGEITSGRQLFGTATWWLLFPNGYAALDALDDNRDGSLSGSELRGIGVWFDKNANGCSDPGEVQPVTEFGVQAIRTRSTGSDHGMPMNAQGIVLKNGTIVPTYDWLVSPIARNPQWDTEKEALENITEAISEYLEVVAELNRDKVTREVEV